jgi:hypothetical protein
MSADLTLVSLSSSPITLPTVSDAELAWLAGLLEGEASFLAPSTLVGGESYRYPKIVVNMADRDVIEHAASLLGGNVVYPLPPSQPHYKPQFRAALSGWAAAERMRELRPWMGERRGAKIDSILAEYDTRELILARRRRSDSGIIAGLAHHPDDADPELAWLAGLLEGEGYFLSFRNTVGGKVYRYPQIVLRMTDLDVVEHANRLLSNNKVSPLPPDKRRPTKTMFRALMQGQKAADLMRQLRPWMGERRGAKIDEILAEHDGKEPASVRRRRSNSEAAARRKRRPDGTFEVNAVGLLTMRPGTAACTRTRPWRTTGR